MNRDELIARKYTARTDFVMPEPTAANFFNFWPLEEHNDAKLAEALASFRANGALSFRLTIVSDEHPNDHYPHGLWFEGWHERNPNQLPFGTSETPDGAISPPLALTAAALRSLVGEG